MSKKVPVAHSDNDWWARAVRVLTGVVLPARADLFDSLLGNNDIPLMRLEFSDYDGEPSNAIVEAVNDMSWRTENSGWRINNTDFVIPFYSGKHGPISGAAPGTKVVMKQARITLLGTNGTDDPPAGGVVVGGEFKSGLGKDFEGQSKDTTWSNVGLSHYSYGGGMALVSLINNGKTTGFDWYGLRVNEKDAVDLDSLNRSAEALDRAARFFKNRYDDLRDWEFDLGKEEASWKGMAAGVFRDMVHGMARNYKSYNEQIPLQGNGSKYGNELRKYRQDIHNASYSLYNKWNTWQLLTGNPLRWLHDILLDVSEWIWKNNITKVRYYEDYGYESYDSYHAVKLDGFHGDHPTYGQLEDKETWKKIGEEAIKKWQQSVVDVLGEAGKAAILAIQNSVNDQDLPKKIDTETTSLSQEFAKDQAAKEKADAERERKRIEEENKRKEEENKRKEEEWKKKQEEAERKAEEKEKEWERKQAEAERKAEEKEKEQERKQEQKEKEQEEKQREQEKKQEQKEKEQEEKQREQEAKQEQKEKEAEAKQAEQEAKQAEKEKEQEEKQAEQERKAEEKQAEQEAKQEQKEKEAEAKQAEQERKQEERYKEQEAQQQAATTLARAEREQEKKEQEKKQAEQEAKQAEKEAEQEEKQAEQERKAEEKQAEQEAKQEQKEKEAEAKQAEQEAKQAEKEKEAEARQEEQEQKRIQTESEYEAKQKEQEAKQEQKEKEAEAKQAEQEAKAEAKQAEQEAKQAEQEAKQEQKQKEAEAKQEKLEREQEQRQADAEKRYERQTRELGGGSPGRYESPDLPSDLPDDYGGQSPSLDRTSGTTTLNPDRTVTLEYPDGTSRTIDVPGGDISTVLPDGSTDFDTLRPGDSITNSDGSITTLERDGTLNTEFPDGSSTRIDPEQGLITNRQPDGTTTTTPIESGETLPSNLGSSSNLHSPSSSSSYDGLYGGGYEDDLYDSTPYNSTPSGNGYGADGSSSGGGMPMLPPGTRMNGSMSGGAGSGDTERVRGVYDDPTQPIVRRLGGSRPSGSSYQEEEIVAARGGGMSTAGGMPFAPPMGGGMGGGQPQTQSSDRERAAWLEEDEDVWGTDEGGAPAVIGR
ncbi:AAWKG family protein [Streptomyces lonegramiae]|uniref:AAWKG family protein n=1 Tax=Streptomyces lonegramiae TaxID=3075524 RepID=A0ABU2XI29_9ACTN|nr:AAWKG family protein [Streptomyces sp. DSM 41529]MDT0545057.1 AAWKG family protein [Streptomyces sp. DSM 41529]